MENGKGPPEKKKVKRKNWGGETKKSWLSFKEKEIGRKSEKNTGRKEMLCGAIMTSKRRGAWGSQNCGSVRTAVKRMGGALRKEGSGE